MFLFFQKNSRLINLSVYIIFSILILITINCNLVNTLDFTNNSNPINTTNSIGMELIEIPLGSFRMGCSNADHNCDSDETPDVKMNISNSFYIGKFEVTKYEFSNFIKETSYKTDAEKKGYKNTWKNCEKTSSSPSHPVICVSWNDAVAFTIWLSKKENKKYRLPDEIEWEYFARAKSETRYYWGFDFEDDYAWYNQNSDRTPHEVGKKKPNQFGLYDITGNVREWCMNSYSQDFLKDKKENLKVKYSSTKAIRGGSWFDSKINLRISKRTYLIPDMKDDLTGFRILLEK